MKSIAFSKYLCLLIHILFLAAVVPSATCAEKLNNYHNEEFRFSFQYPASWVERPGSVPNLRVKVVAPANTKAVECAVVVKRYPKATSAKQSDIDQIFIVPPTPSEVEEIFSQANNSFKVSTASTGTLHSHPAHVARVQYKTVGNTYASGRVLMTATPGLTWTLSCSGLGGTSSEAEKNYQFWESKINNLVSSFKFL